MFRLETCNFFAMCFRARRWTRPWSLARCRLRHSLFASKLPIAARILFGLCRKLHCFHRGLVSGGSQPDPGATDRKQFVAYSAKFYGVKTAQRTCCFASLSLSLSTAFSLSCLSWILKKVLESENKITTLWAVKTNRETRWWQWMKKRRTIAVNTNVKKLTARPKNCGRRKQNVALLYAKISTFVASLFFLLLPSSSFILLLPLLLLPPPPLLLFPSAERNRLRAGGSRPGDEAHSGNSWGIALRARIEAPEAEESQVSRRWMRSYLNFDASRGL